MPTADGPCRFGQYARLHASPAGRARLPPGRGAVADEPQRLRRPGHRWRARSSARRGACWSPPTSCRSSCCSTAHTSAGSAPPTPRSRSAWTRCAGRWRAGRPTPAAQLRAPARRAGPLPHAVHRPRHAARSDAAAHRRRRRDLLPPQHVLERGRGAAPGAGGRRGLAVRDHRVDLVHGLGAVPEAAPAREGRVDGDRRDLDPGEGAAPRRAGAARAVPQRLRGIRGARRGRGGRGGAPLPAAGRRARRDGAERRDEPSGWPTAAWTASSTSARSPA